jgi:predicted RNA-binding Zn-ribbon protein involved in translation (DUF1610 family)
MTRTNSPFPPPGFVRAESAVPGIELYRPAPPVEQHQTVVDFRCPQCNGVTAYCTDDGALTCAYCGYHEAPQAEWVGRGAEAFEFTVETMRRATTGWGEMRKELVCHSCGAHTTLSMEMLTHSCPFCASNQVVQMQAPQDALRPRFLIPFGVTLAQCREEVATWLESSWMTPAGLRSLARTAEFTPIYIPAWTFDARGKASWRAEVGHRQTYTTRVNGRTQTRTRTVWRWESGSVNHYFDDMLISGTSKLSHLLLQKVKEVDLNGLVAYEASFLAGLQAQAYDVNLEDAWEQARHAMREETRLACRAQASTNKVRNFSMSLDFSEESWRYILLPIYLAVYRYQTRRMQVMVNGQTGQIAGQRPVAWGKVALACLAALSPGLFFALLSLILLLFGLELGGLVLLGALFALLIGAGVSGYFLWTAWQLDKA